MPEKSEKEKERGVIREGPNKNILTQQEAQERIAVLGQNAGILGEKSSKWLTSIIQADASAEHHYGGYQLRGISTRTPEEIGKIIEVASNSLGKDAGEVLNNFEIWSYTPEAVHDIIKEVLSGMGEETGRAYLIAQSFTRFHIMVDNGFRYLTQDEIRQRIELCKATLGVERMHDYFKTEAGMESASLNGLFTENSVKKIKVMERYLGSDTAQKLFSGGWLHEWSPEFTEESFELAVKLIGSEKEVREYFGQHPNVMYSIGNFIDRDDYNRGTQNFDYLASKFGKDVISELIMGPKNSRLIGERLRSLSVDEDKVKQVADRIALEITDTGNQAERERFAMLTLDVLGMVQR